MNAKVYFLVSFLILGVVSCNDSKKESVDEALHVFKDLVNKLKNEL